MRRADWSAAFAGLAWAVLGSAAALRGHAQNRITAAPLPPAATSPAPPPGRLTVLDHVVAVINGDVILESDVQEEMRFAVLQPDRADPARNTAQGALQRLIDRDLILQQIKLAQGTPAPPTAQQVEQQLSELRKQIPDCARYHCETEAGWQSFLKAHGLTQPEVEAHWRERMLILSFIQSRFGAGVRISQAETEEYYNKNFAPEFARKDLKPPPLEAVASRIQEILLQQRVNSFMREWLQSLKDEGNVSILSTAYSEVGSPDDQDSGGRP